MQNDAVQVVSLNFSKKEKTEIKKAMQAYPEKKVTAQFEEKRWLAENCTITLYSSGKLVVQGKNAKLFSEKLLKKIIKTEDIIIGIDETGRGENQGVFTIAAVLADTNKMREMRDSKKTHKIEKKAEAVNKNALATIAVTFSPEFVDLARKNGVNLNELQRRFICLAPQMLFLPGTEFKTKVDGSELKGAENAEFIKAGDDIEPVIGAASVLAKHLRNTALNKNKRLTWKKS